MELEWTDKGWDDYLKWKNDVNTLRRINRLLDDIVISPFAGIGKPEPLKGNLSGCWSRRIDDKNRIVYRVCDEIVEIAQCRGHY